MVRLERLAGLALLMAACGGAEVEEDDVLTGCPPAPLRDEGRACDFALATTPEQECKYRTPQGLGTESPEYCNGASCTCAEGRLTCRRTLVHCSPHRLPECPAGALSGAACSQTTSSGSLDNGECAVTGPDADLDAGIIHGHVCACDLPGPTWRCLPVEETKR